MKTITLISLILLLCGQQLLAQSSTWFATLSGSERNVESTKEIAHDEYGNIYTISSSENELNVIRSSYQNQSYTLPPTKGYHLILSKYNPSGKILWTLPINGRTNAVSNIICDNQGGIYLAGTYNNETNLSSTNGQHISISNDRIPGCFLAKYNYNGELESHNYIVGGGDVNNITFDKSGAVFLSTGNTNMSSNLTLTSNVRVNFSYKDENVLIVKYSAACQYLDHWTVSAEELTRIQVHTNSQNQIILGGAYKGTLNLDNQVSLRAKYNGEKLGGDIFLATLSSIGKVQWSKSFGGATANFLGEVLIDSQDNIIIDGIIRSEIIINNERLYNSAGYMRGFWAKLDASGNTIWKAIQPRCAFNTIKLNAKDEIYLVGDYSKSMTMPDINKRFTSSTDNPSPSIVAKYSPEGKCIWATKITNSPLISNFDIVKGQLYICGILKGRPNTVCFQTDGNPDGFVIPRNDHFDGFVAKLGALPNENIDSNPIQQENNNTYQDSNPYTQKSPIRNTDTRNDNGNISNNNLIGQHELLLTANKMIEIEIKDEKGEVIYRTKIPANGKYDMKVTPQ